MSTIDELYEDGNDEITSNFPTRNSQYWPETLIQQLVQKHSVLSALNEAEDKYDQELVDYILRDAKRLFAIAAATEADRKWLLNVMRFFKQHNYKDDDISAEVGGKCLVKEALSELNPKLWGRGRALRICETQWKVVVPVISTEKDNYDFIDKAILPFNKIRSVDAGGAFSAVSEVSIREGHFKDSSRSVERQRITNSWANEARTLRRMNASKNDHILRFITAFTRCDIGTEKSYYLVFEWADGGSLNSLFTQNPTPTLTAELVKHTATQLLGLAEALKATHDAEIRHGDIKPDNILHFKPTEGNKIIGTLKIGDWGLAKHHPIATILRLKNKQQTDTRFGTTAYEPPEVELAELKLLSRQYDIWSMGCVILEIIVWLVYGYEGVHNFRLDVQGPHRESVPFYIIEEVVVGKIKARAKLQKVVEQWLDFMAKEPVCDADTALGELLNLVRRKLLIVELPPNMGQTVYVKNWDTPSDQSTALDPMAGGGIKFSLKQATAVGDQTKGLQKHRATSAELVAALGREDAGILDDSDRPDDYWLKPTLERRPVPRFYNSFPKAIQDATGHLMPGLLPPNAAMLDGEWEIQPDEKFATGVLSTIKPNLDFRPLSPRGSPSRLCISCKSLDFFRDFGLKVEYSIDYLESQKDFCKLCALFLDTAKKHNKTGSRKIRFDKERSWLRFDNAGPPVLSICRTLGMHLSPTQEDDDLALTVPQQDSKVRNDIHLRLPRLPVSGSKLHFELIRQWLNLCDANHPGCSGSTQSMPTRVIDVGSEDDEVVHLWQTGPHDKEQYVALSHPWGHTPHFVTNVGNLAQHIEGIQIKDLPATFKDAIYTTRALGKRFLWIDSICIIQGPGGDFHSQAKQMETVFSSAYCVLAASRAHSQADGFLGSRRPRNYVMLNEADGSPFYICEYVDDFNKDVLNGHLNKRGWVLQEHALARRTVFFAEAQTYFECGDGSTIPETAVADTPFHLNSNLAAFLGDPKFPRIIMTASRGERIIRLQDLYKNYSSLDFTRAHDRPIAMDGIHSRLLKAFGAKGGYGMFDQGNQNSGLLRRVLLWYRPGDTPTLERIKFPREQPVPPSWSWMAYTGKIDFLRLQFDGIEWKEIWSPWCKQPGLATTDAGPRGDVVLRGRVRSINASFSHAGEEGELHFDMPSERDTTSMQCVVLGIEHDKVSPRPLAERRHYFILVQPAESRDLMQPGGGPVYKRVGAGYLPGRFITPVGEEVQIR
ncbi:hypothetical protein OQA88_7246 [Cercophora sp. LCS_1]